MLVRESSFCLKASPSTGSLCNDADLTRPSRVCRTAASANKALAPSGFTGGTLFFGVPLFCKRDAVFRKRGPHIRPIPAPSPVRVVGAAIMSRETWYTAAPARRPLLYRPTPANPHPAAPSTSLRASVATLARQSVFFARHSPSFASLGRVRTRPPVSISFAEKRKGLISLQASSIMEIPGEQHSPNQVRSGFDESFRRDCI